VATDPRPPRMIARALTSIVIVLVGLLALDLLFAGAGWSWLLVAVVGVVAGAVARDPRVAWPAVAAVAVYHIATISLDLPRDSGPFWYIGATAAAALLIAAVLVGTNVGWRRGPLPAARDGWRSLRPWSRRLSLAIAIVVVLGLLGYGVFAGLRVSAEFTEAIVTAPDCRTPADMYRWDYEAINYDKADDARLTAANPDKTKCAVVGTDVGTDVVTTDGIKLAGWYIPAAGGVGPGGPTLLIVHGWKADKTGALEYAPPFHQDYNLVLFDLRNNGRSSGDQTSMGLYEQRDVIAMLDWLVGAKHPSWIGAVGNSMGAATVLAATVTDQRIQALILDSMHADIVTSVGNAMEEDFHVPGGVAAWIGITAVSLRVGGDVTSIDPVRMIGRLGNRPVLLLQGTHDQVDPPVEASDRNFRAALDTGVPVELAYCPGARHGLVRHTCPGQWAAWATAFLERVRSR
jgi:uncharacterized protein